MFVIRRLSGVCRGLVCLTLLFACVTGCVERTISITSDPPGALVYLNDEEVGRTPLAVPFLFYGTYDVRMERDGYQPLWVQQEAVAPWWEAPGPDLIAEMVPHLKAEQRWHFVMEVLPLAQTGAVVERAQQLRAMLAPLRGQGKAAKP